ncbi:MAG TPA: response regulator transcription factor [Polyangiaceae bacterium]|jgi:DNA-binding NarL/FixJ family response regulator|nr:response regulator transcription factor [Polyangiaceae bacterium]
MSTKKTILLVEDEFDTRELLGRALERAGHAALLAENAAAALSAARDAPQLDLVVTDVVLGADSFGGLGLMTELRREGLRVPVVIITAYADVEKLKIALNEGAAHFLEKPFSAPKLLEVIERVLKTTEPFHHAVEEILLRAQLTEKELRVARLLLEGFSSNEIAARENNSPKTIRQHVTQIYAKCGVASRAQFFRLAYLR